MNGKTWGIFIVIVIAIVSGMIYMSMQDKLDLSDIDKQAASEIFTAEGRNGNIGDHVFGNKDAKVLIIEYGDYQCPGCATTAPVVRAVAKKYEDSTALIFRNWPIPSLHPNGRAASAAAEAAGLQGKIWEMHDLLFATQKSWQSASVSERSTLFADYASQIGINVDKFNKDSASEAVAKKIDFDTALGKIKGVTGTPALFVNGKQIESASVLEEEVKSALKKAGVEVKSE